MADNIVDIAFSNVQFQEFGGTIVATITGTLEVDYTTGSATGTLSVSLGGPPVVTFTSFIIGSGPDFAVTSFSDNNNIVITYTGEQPTVITGSAVHLGGIGSFPTLISSSVTSSPVCYVEGTLIRTPRGDVAVESLQVGDLVETSSGELRPIKWLGRRFVDCRRYANSRVVHPVRIARDSFGPNRPSQDLFVSSGHSLCVDLCGEVLIPAGDLINGATIAQVAMEHVTYWHVELDSHDVLIANNLPAESYFEHGNRAFFDEVSPTMLVFDEGHTKTRADFCRPVVLDGPVLAFARQRLEARAELLGWSRSYDADLHLVADGEVHRPCSGGDAAVFLFPAAATDVRLKSNTFVPAEVGIPDARSLGISLRALVFSGSGGEPRSVAPHELHVADGVHPEEAQSACSWRWTTGELSLSPDFWQGLSGHVALLINHDVSATRRWLAPARAEAAESRPRLYALSGRANS